MRRKTSSTKKTTTRHEKSSESLANPLEIDKLSEIKDKRTTVKTKLIQINRNRLVANNCIVFVGLSDNIVKNKSTQL